MFKELFSKISQNIIYISHFSICFQYNFCYNTNIQHIVVVVYNYNFLGGNIMKKLLSIILTIVMVLSLAACGSSEEKKSDDTDKTTQKKEEVKKEDKTTKKEEAKKEETKKEEKKDGVKLSVSIWDEGQRAGLEKIMEAFTAKTGIEAEIQVIGWNDYWTLLASGASGGQLPDVFWMHSNESQKYMENDILLDLTDKIAKSEDIDLANYPDQIMGLYTLNDKYYAVPKDIDTIALWYNKTMFDEAGIEYPNENWTYDDLYEAAKKLTKADGSVYGISSNVDQNQTGYYNYIYSNGGSVISDDKTKSMWNDPKTVEAMELYGKMAKEKIMPPLEVMSENKDHVLFQSGKVAMITTGSWMLAGFKENDYMKKNCDIAVMPKAKDGHRASIYNGLGWAAAANTEHPEEAWRLLEYLGSKEAQEMQAKLGVTMSAYKGTSKDWVKSTDLYNLDAYLFMLDEVPDMVIRPYSRNTVAWEGMSIEELKPLWQGEKTAKEVCDEIAKKMDEILAEE